jgi:hypothetical protein
LSLLLLYLNYDEFLSRGAIPQEIESHDHLKFRNRVFAADGTAIVPQQPTKETGFLSTLGLGDRDLVKKPGFC